jgi:hypothetical protein
VRREAAEGLRESRRDGLKVAQDAVLGGTDQNGPSPVRDGRNPCSHGSVVPYGTVRITDVSPGLRPGLLSDRPFGTHAEFFPQPVKPLRERPSPSRIFSGVSRARIYGKENICNSH